MLMLPHAASGANWLLDVCSNLTESTYCTENAAPHQWRCVNTVKGSCEEKLLQLRMMVVMEVVVVVVMKRTRK